MMLTVPCLLLMCLDFLDVFVLKSYASVEVVEHVHACYLVYPLIKVYKAISSFIIWAESSDMSRTNAYVHVSCPVTVEWRQSIDFKASYKRIE